MKLYRRVTRREAESVIDNGFEDHAGTYSTDRVWHGVWVANKPLDCNEGAALDAESLLEIKINLPERTLAEYEWVEEGKTYREWLIPAHILNQHAKVRLVEDEDTL